MTSTFLVTLELPDTSPDTLMGTAELIKESLEMDGFIVKSVEPWARPVTAPDLAPANAISKLQIPTPSSEPPASALML